MGPVKSMWRHDQDDSRIGQEFGVVFLGDFAAIGTCAYQFLQILVYVWPINIAAISSNTVNLGISKCNYFITIIVPVCT